MRINISWKLWYLHALNVQKYFTIKQLSGCWSKLIKTAGRYMYLWIIWFCSSYGRINIWSSYSWTATVTTEEEGAPDFSNLDVFYPTKDWQEVKPGKLNLLEKSPSLANYVLRSSINQLSFAGTWFHELTSKKLEFNNLFLWLK